MESIDSFVLGWTSESLEGHTRLNNGNKGYVQFFEEQRTAHPLLETKDFFDIQMFQVNRDYCQSPNPFTYMNRRFTWLGI